MKEEVVELYGDDNLAQLEWRIKRWSVLLFALTAVALASCVGMIAFTNTGNAVRMEVFVIILSTLVGWIVIYASVFVVTMSRRELAHANMLRNDERQMVKGAVTVTDERIRIKRSITVRRVEVRTDGALHRLLVCETRAAALAAAGTDALYTVHGYVAAYEVSL